MIRLGATAHLDGNFRRQHPEPDRFSYRHNGVWHVVAAGPGYVNRGQVLEYDDVGERWLLANERPAIPDPTPDPDAGVRDEAQVELALEDPTA